MTNQIIIKHQRKTEQHCELLVGNTERCNEYYASAFLRPKISSSNIEKAKTTFSYESEWPKGDVLGTGHPHVSDVAADAFLKSLLIKFKNHPPFRSVRFVVVAVAVQSNTFDH